jgi:phenylalanyl-tRNA synthetase beta subunit
LIKEGFSEIITSSFQKKGNLQLQNALASDKSYLRESLIKNITSALDLNYTHTDLLGLLAVRVFEIGTVFHKSDSGVGEHISLAIGVRTKGDGYNKKDDPLLDSSMKIVEAVLGQNLNWQVEKGVAELNLN